MPLLFHNIPIGKTDLTKVSIRIVLIEVINQSRVFRIDSKIDREFRTQRFPGAEDIVDRHAVVVLIDDRLRERYLPLFNGVRVCGNRSAFRPDNIANLVGDVTSRKCRPQIFNRSQFRESGNPESGEETFLAPQQDFIGSSFKIGLGFLLFDRKANVGKIQRIAKIHQGREGCSGKGNEIVV